MKQLIYGLAAALTLAACASPVHVTGTGGIRMSVRWPESKGFQIKVIPANTQSLEIIVTGQGLSVPKSQTLTRASGNQQTLEMELPVGSKRVVVRALSGSGEILADATDNIDVRPGQTSRLELDLNPMPLASPTPATNPGTGSNGQGSTVTPGNSGQSGSGTNPDPNNPDPQPSAENPASPSPGPVQPSSSPTSTPSSSGGGGGGGGGGSSSGQTAPTLTDLTANPQTVTGLSYPSEITAVISDPDNTLQAQHFTWSCLDTTGSIPCNHFTTTTQPNRVVWQAPSVAGGPYAITVNINNGIHPALSRTVQITVQSGSGTLNGNGGAFDGGQTGGQ